jgi:tetratricopeptide (TPR) repeat protein
LATFQLGTSNSRASDTIVSVTQLNGSNTANVSMVGSDNQLTALQSGGGATLISTVDATGTKSDSLYNLVLKGSEGKFGVVRIADEYSGTDAGNLANYYAGISYLNTKKYTEAIASLEKFKSDDIMLSTIAIGAIGDAYAQQNKQKDALEYYIKAADANKNELTRPRYLLKAGKTALVIGNKADALKYFTDIKDNYDTAPEAQSIDALIGLAQ